MLFMVCGDNGTHLEIIPRKNSYFSGDGISNTPFQFHLKRMMLTMSILKTYKQSLA